MVKGISEGIILSGNTREVGYPNKRVSRKKIET